MSVLVVHHRDFVTLPLSVRAQSVEHMPCLPLNMQQVRIQYAAALTILRACKAQMALREHHSRMRLKQ